MSDITRLKVFKGLGLLVALMLGLMLCSGVVHADLTLAPDFTFTDIDGNTHSLSSFRGSVVILDFFAPDCSYCMSEMGQLRTVQNAFGSNLAIISICVHQFTDEALRQYIDDPNSVHPEMYATPGVVTRDTAQVWEQLYGTYSSEHAQYPGIPSIYTIDQAGYLRYPHPGFVVSDIPNASVLIGEVHGLLSDPLPGDLNGDGTVGLADLVILARAYGSKPGDPNWNPVADIDGNGIVGLSDLVILAQHYGQHYP